MTDRGQSRRDRSLSAAAALMAVLLAGAALPLGAQRPDQSHWALDGSRGSFCVWYLSDPALADKLADHETPSMAGTGEGLPRGLVQVIRDEPKFAQWVPGVVCVGMYDSVVVARHASRGKPGRPVLVVYDAVRARAPRHADGADWLLLDIGTDRRDLSSDAGDAGVATADARLTVHPSDPGRDPDITVRISGTDITWSGHPFGDASVGTTRSMSFGYRGERSTDWSVALEATPDSSRPMVGALRIDGTSTLAKALKSSPIREVGPWEAGGAASLTFQKATAH